MTETQMILLVIILAAAVMLTRFLPFLLFGKMEEPPAFIDYLGKVLPAAMMGLLVVYCFKDLDFTRFQSILPTLIAAAATAGLHLWKRNTILSIALGTAIYMILIRVM